MGDLASPEFRREMIKYGIVSFKDQDSVFSIAQKCAAQVGLPLGVAIGAATSGAGAVVVPGIGSIPAGLAGFLAGLATGTAACTALNLTYRDQLRALVSD